MAITPQTVATNEELVESFLDRVYEPHKIKIWGGIAVFFAVVIAYLGQRTYHESRRDDMWVRYRQATEGFALDPMSETNTAAARKQADSLKLLIADFPNEPVTPFALQQLVKAQLALGEYEAALKTLDQLRSEFKDAAPNTLPADVDASGQARSITQKLEDAIKRERDWVGKNTYEHHWPSEDRLALVETTSGSFWMGFYSGPDEAPLHTSAFIEHAKKGDYNGTQVYHLMQDTDGTPMKFECGSRASGLEDRGGSRNPATHNDDEPTDTIEPEDARSTIRHQYRVVSAVKMESGESSMRFNVVVKRPGLEKLNGETTPFAAVIDREKSLETIDLIGRSSTYGSEPRTAKSDNVFTMKDNPFPPIYIRRVSIWAKEKLEDGHAWITDDKVKDIVGTPTAELWEAARPAPMPDEFKK